MEGKMSMFPQKQRRTSRFVKSEDSIELFCICHMPEIPPMVECSQCSNWYHVSCVSVPQEALDHSTLLIIINYVVNTFVFHCEK